MKKLTLCAAAAALSVASSAAFAVPSYISTTNSLTGEVVITGMADGTPGTFNVVLRDLNGTVQVVVPPNGNYGVTFEGFVSVTPVVGFPAMTLSVNNPNNIFNGLLTAAGLSAGVYNKTFTPGANNVNDGAGSNIGFVVNDDGNTSADVLGLITTLTGVAPATTAGSGTLAVTGQLFDDGAVLSIVESNLTWAGFGRMLAAADLYAQQHQFPGNTLNLITSDFAMRNVAVAIPEPASMALVGLGLAGLAAVRRRKTA